MLVHPVALEGVAASPRLPRATIALVVAALLAHAVERLAGWSLGHHGPLGEHLARAVASAAASARIYGEASLFAPWQPWTSAFAAAGWWQLAQAGVVVLVVGSALEAELGSLALISALLAIAPLAAVGGLLGDPEAGLSGVACALLGLALARRPGARVRWGFSYYAVVEVGHVPLFRGSLADLTALYLALELMRCLIQRGGPAGGGSSPWGAWLAGLAAGAALGLLSRRLRPPASAAA